MCYGEALRVRMYILCVHKHTCCTYKFCLHDIQLLRVANSALFLTCVLCVC